MTEQVASRIRGQGAKLTVQDRHHRFGPDRGVLPARQAPSAIPRRYARLTSGRAGSSVRCSGPTGLKKSSARRLRMATPSHSRTISSPGTASPAPRAATSIKFVQKIDGLSFVEAVERLAGRAGIDLRYEQGGYVPGQEQSHRRRLIDAHRAAAEFYAEQLRKPEADIAGRSWPSAASSSPTRSGSASATRRRPGRT